VFYRERGALPYDPFAYGVAIAMVEVPYLILQVGQGALQIVNLVEGFGLRVCKRGTCMPL